MFGIAIIQQHMQWTTRRVRDTFCDGAVTSGGDVWTTDSGVVRVHEGESQIPEPLRIGISIVINVSDYLTCRCFSSGVPRAAQPAVLGVDHTKAILFGDRSGA